MQQQLDGIIRQQDEAAARRAEENEKYLRERQEREAKRERDFRTIMQILQKPKVEEVQSAQVNSISSFGFEVYPGPSSPPEVEVDEETNRMGEQSEEYDFLDTESRRDT